MKTFLKITIFVLLIILSTKTTYACIPTADNWFNFTTEFQIKNLPKDVDIATNSLDGNTYVSSSSEIPTYIVKREERMPWNKYPNSGVGEQYIPQNKFVSDKAYYWSSSSDNTEWTLDPSTPNRLPINKFDWTIRDGELMQVKEDDRPKNIKIPNPQEIYLLLLHNDKEIEIDGKIIYSLNKDYNPNSSKIGAEFCNQFGSDDLLFPKNTNKVVVGSAIGILIFAIGLIIYWKRKNK